MLRRPVFRPHLQTSVVPGVGLFLLSEAGQTVLQGRLYEVIGAELDGREIEELCVALQDNVSPAQIFYTVSQLQKKGFVCEHSESWSASEGAYWEIQQCPPEEAAQRHKEATVSVTAFGNLNPAPFVNLLKSMQIQVVDDGQFGVVLTDHYLRPELAEYNRQSLERGRSWMLAKPNGRILWVGPLMVPGTTGCWECLVQRIRANFPILGYLETHDADPSSLAADRAATPATIALGLNLTAVAVQNWVGRGENPEFVGKIKTLDVMTWQTLSHSLLRQPSCDACGTPPKENADPLADARPFLLESRMKGFTEDAGHRTRRPLETIQKYEHLVSPISGVVSMLEKLHVVGDGIMHVYQSGRNVARGPADLANLRHGLRSASAGKGTTEEQAKASAICEALERYSGIFKGNEPRKPARLVDLGEDGIHPNSCMLYSDRQYENRVELNAHSSMFDFIPTRFDPEEVVDWTPIWSLTQEKFRLIPTAFCYFSYPEPPGREICVGCSNGNAAGSTLEEAVLQGTFELVERDSVATWWYNRVQRPAVDVDSFHEPYCDRLQEFFREHSREMWVLDLTNDLGIPTFAAFSRRTDIEEEHILFGFGCHFEPRVALLRAVTELNQMLSHIMDAPVGLKGCPLDDHETMNWLKTAKYAELKYLIPSNEPATTPTTHSVAWSDDLTEDVRHCQRIFEAKGMEMLVLNHTRPEIGLPAVKVIVPGLRHFWARFAPGRLYDVPVQMGWLKEPLREEDLNPAAMFL